MAQIFGSFWSHPLPTAAEAAAAMGQRLRRPTQGRAEIWCDPQGRGGLGAMLAQERGSFSVVADPRGEIVVAVDGRVDFGRSGDQRCDQLLVESYRQKGTDFVRELKGSFALALFDSAQRTLIVATDRLSTRALFWTRLPQGLAFCSELKGLLALPDWRAQVDPEAIASYLRYGRLFGRRTMCQGVELLLPGRVLVYQLDTDSATDRQVQSLEPLVLERRPMTPDRLRDLSDAFGAGVAKTCPSSGKVGLSLSGGLDSRGILAVLMARKVNTVMRTEGFEGCMDERVGARLSSATGFPWSFQPLRKFDIESYVESTRRYVYLTEGMLVPEGFPGIGPIRFAHEEGLSVLQRGHGGENARVGDAWPFQVNAAALALSERSQLAGFLEPASEQASSDIRDLFADEPTRRAVANPADHLASFAAGIDSSLTPAETLSLMYLRINDGGQVTAFRNCLRGYADMALPYLEDDFLDLVLTTRVVDRRDESIHHHLIHAHCPALMKVPNSNHGAPLDASRLRRLVTEKSHALFRKLRLPGFRHYHYVDTWLKQLLRSSVESLLLDRRSLERGLVSPQKLREIVADPSVPGRPRLLARLVTIEMWQQLFCDRDLDRYSLSLQ
jgi:asparagine synthase (glutamine-hydrolysing)